MTKLNIKSIDQLREEIDKWLNSISSPDNPNYGDWEVIHSREDEILQATLRWIASGECMSPQHAAIAVCMMEFDNHPRWYA